MLARFSRRIWHSILHLFAEELSLWKRTMSGHGHLTRPARFGGHPRVPWAAALNLRRCESGAMQVMNERELTGRTALVTGVTRRAGIGAAIARELGRAGARLFVTFFPQYDRQQAWGVEPNEPESLLGELRSIADEVAGTEMD